MSLAPRAFLSTGSPQADERERLCAVSCFCAVAGLWALRWSGTVQGGWPVMVKIASLVVLGSACYAVWSTNRIWDVPARSFRRSLALWLARVQDVLQPGGHAEARVLSRGSDSSSLVVAVEAMARSERPLASEIAQGFAASEAIGAVTAEVAEGLEALGTGMRAITQHISRVSNTASGAAGAAFVASNAIGETSARIASVAEAADTLQRGFVQIASNNDSEGVTGGRDVAHTAMPLLDGLLAQVCGLTQAASESDALLRHFISALIEQDGAGEELGRRISLQTEAIAALLARFASIEKGAGGLCKNLEAIQTLQRTSHEASAAVWRAAEQFPGRAETIARLLRELPDFAPKASRQGA